MCSLNVSEMRHHQQFRVPMQNKLKVLFAEGDHRSVVHNDVVQKGVCLLVRVIDRFLVELKLAYSQTTQNHKWGCDRDYNRELPSKDETNKAGEEQAKSSFDSYAYTLSRQPVYRADVFRDDVCQNARSSILIIKPADVLPEDCGEQFNSESKGQIFTTPTKEVLL